MLSGILIIYIIGIILNNNIIKNIKIINMIIFILLLYIVFWQILIMNNNSMEYQERLDYNIYINKYSIGLDGINISLILLLSIIYPIILWISNESRSLYNKLYIIYIIIIMIFIVLDLFLFYLFFELILIPMFIIIGIYGTKYKRIEASYRFILYTFSGSLLMILSIIIIGLLYGTTNLEYLIYNMQSSNKDTIILLWILFSISLLVKLPIFPFHTWLPIVHVESPTIGSILLAAILLKLSTFGFIKYNIPLFSYYNIYIAPILIILIILSIYYSSFINLRQIDLKKIIAYSSIVHMNFGLYGLFTNNLNGFYGSLFSNLSHGIVSSALFFLVGILYIRYHTRILTYYTGIINVMPIFSLFFFLFILHNIAIPFSSSFIGELYILLSSYLYNNYITFLLIFSLLLSTSYNIWMISRILLTTPTYILLAQDLTYNEYIILLSLLIISFLLGIFPSYILLLFSPYILPLLY